MIPCKAYCRVVRHILLRNYSCIAAIIADYAKIDYFEQIAYEIVYLFKIGYFCILQKRVLFLCRRDHYFCKFGYFCTAQITDLAKKALFQRQLIQHAICAKQFSSPPIQLCMTRLPYATSTSSQLSRIAIALHTTKLEKKFNQNIQAIRQYIS